jgi:hypothetical protein
LRTLVKYKIAHFKKNCHGSLNWPLCSGPDHIASFIVNANGGIMWTAGELDIVDCMAMQTNLLVAKTPRSLCASVHPARKQSDEHCALL